MSLEQLEQELGDRIRGSLREQMPRLEADTEAFGPTTTSDVDEQRPTATIIPARRDHDRVQRRHTAFTVGWLATAAAAVGVLAIANTLGDRSDSSDELSIGTPNTELIEGGAGRTTTIGETPASMALSVVYDGYGDGILLVVSAPSSDLIGDRSDEITSTAFDTWRTCLEDQGGRLDGVTFSPPVGADPETIWNHCRAETNAVVGERLAGTGIAVLP